MPSTISVFTVSEEPGRVRWAMSASQRVGCGRDQDALGRKEGYAGPTGRKGPLVFDRPSVQSPGFCSSPQLVSDLRADTADRPGFPSQG